MKTCCDALMELNQWNKDVVYVIGIMARRNAFSILGRFNAAAKKAGWTPEEIKSVHDDATSGDYAHLLRVICDNIEEPEPEEDEDEEQKRCFNCREEWCAYDICEDCENCPDCCEC